MGMNGYISRYRDINREQPDGRMDCVFWESLFERYYKNVYNYIGFRINNHHDAEDLACSVFVSAVQKFHTYKPERSPAEAWLIGIAKNTVTDYLRTGKRKVPLSLDDVAQLASPDMQPEDVAVKNEENKALIQAMSKLKEKERQILSMKFATDLKNIEIARLLGMSESNVGVTIHRSVSKLRIILEKEGAVHG